jgi:hypothetical protein
VCKKFKKRITQRNGMYMYMILTLSFLCVRNLKRELHREMVCTCIGYIVDHGEVDYNEKLVILNRLFILTNSFDLISNNQTKMSLHPDIWLKPLNSDFESIKICLAFLRLLMLMQHRYMYMILTLSFLCVRNLKRELHREMVCTCIGYIVDHLIVE